MRLFIGLMGERSHLSGIRRMSSFIPIPGFVSCELYPLCIVKEMLSWRPSTDLFLGDELVAEVVSPGDVDVAVGKL
ncbi:protein PINHEAD [Corchorus olitorius]|uniref:Protein PINHEAD n=1 Tax=Corchorus olitorius TaxID=93759 RepID=A0A1R3G589_9ROSI|nr:protein PINHEAD [Corchorus olitorius]